jgi:hypothetical protein
MDEFDNPDWNLAQVAAWVVYREAELVIQLANPDRHDFGTIGMYKSTWPDHRQIHDTLDDLMNSLRNGSITAYGYHCDSPNNLEPVPKKAWADLHLRPPFTYLTENLNVKFQPWKNIRFESSAVKKHWRSVFETSGKSRFDWKTIRSIYEDVHKSNPEFTKNNLIVEVQGAYRDKFNKEPPSRTSFFRNIKTWT